MLDQFITGPNGEKIPKLPWLTSTTLFTESPCEPPPLNHIASKRIPLSDFRIFAEVIDGRNAGEVTEITDWLYFFEENHIDEADADGLYRGNCTYQIWLEPK